MVPQIKTRFRKRNGVPYAIESLTGRQYRCRICNAIFYSADEFEKHLNYEAKTNSGKKVNNKCPKLDNTISVLVYYTEDILNAFKAVKVKKFKKGEIYDGRLKTKRS
jgi:uncharacterized C2H2 Zn-finger protein